MSQPGSMKIDNFSVNFHIVFFLDSDIYRKLVVFRINIIFIVYVNENSESVYWHHDSIAVLLLTKATEKIRKSKCHQPLYVKFLR